jgi:hypothetical protein
MGMGGGIKVRWQALWARKGGACYTLQSAYCRKTYGVVCGAFGGGSPVVQGAT